jgi:hypothetical protein
VICFNGEDVRPENNGVPQIESMGVHLGRIMRFGGGTRDIYSVLCHTLVVMAIMPEEFAIHGLFHDVPEMCCSDVPTPWKTPQALDNERILLDRIYRHYKLPAYYSVPAVAALEHADRAALAAEAHVLGHPKAKEYWPTYEPEVARLTSAMAENVHRFMIADVASQVFQEAYEACLQVV